MGAHGEEPPVGDILKPRTLKGIIDDMGLTTEEFTDLL